MKVLVSGVSRQYGTSKKTGNPYDMYQVRCLTPVNPVRSESFNVDGFGFEETVVELAPEALQAFAKVKFPAELDLDTDVQPRFGDMRTVVVGIKSPISKVA